MVIRLAKEGPKPYEEEWKAILDRFSPLVFPASEVEYPRSWVFYWKTVEMIPSHLAPPRILHYDASHPMTMVKELPDARDTSGDFFSELHSALLRYAEEEPTDLLTFRTTTVGHSRDVGHHLSVVPSPDLSGRDANNQQHMNITFAETTNSAATDRDSSKEERRAAGTANRGGCGEDGVIDQQEDNTQPSVASSDQFTSIKIVDMESQALTRSDDAIYEVRTVKT